MRQEKERTTEDKVMIAIILLGIAILLAIAIFAALSMEAGTYSTSSGVKALAALAIFTAMFYRALRKRLDGSIR